jgi:FkbM family methyltransferase
MNQMLAVLTRIRDTGFLPSDALDIGAYEGSWAKAASIVFPGLSIVMIEAQAEKQEHLERLHQYSEKTFRYHIAMLGAENRESVTFYKTDTDSGSTGSSMYEEQTHFPRNAVSLPMIQLDSLLEQYPERAFSLAKLDVQGAELDVLRGGRRLLKDAEFVAMELSLMPYNKSAPLLAEVVSFMDANGFAPIDIFEPKRDGKGQLVQIDFVFARKGSEFTPKLALST